MVMDVIEFEIITSLNNNTQGVCLSDHDLIKVNE